MRGLRGVVRSGLGSDVELFTFWGWLKMLGMVAAADFSKMSFDAFVPPLSELIMDLDLGKSD